MTRFHWLTGFAVLALSCSIDFAQVPQADIDPALHSDLAAAQQSLIQAFRQISDAQRTDGSQLGGHAGRAKQLLLQANDELRASVVAVDQRGGTPETGAAPAGPSPSATPAAPVNLSGTWTIFAEDAHQPGSSLKSVELTQSGNILTGSFHGPHQHGKLQGWVQGNHVEFSTDTRSVLTFRGEVTSAGMSGMYSANGGVASWRAQRGK